MHFPRILAILPLIALPAAVVVDLGSVALVRMAVPDDAQEAGRAAVLTIQFQKAPTSLNAATAFAAADNVAKLHREVIDPNTFTIYQDGSVNLTVSKTAPTALFKHLPGLRDLTKAKATATTTRAHY